MSRSSVESLAILVEDSFISPSGDNIVLLCGTQRDKGSPDVKKARISEQAGGLVFHAMEIGLSGLAIQPVSDPELRTFDAGIKGLTGVPIGEQAVEFK